MSNYFEILGLQWNGSGIIGESEIKQAYRRALLQTHPDKLHSNSSTPEPTTNTVQDIRLAYEVLIQNQQEYIESLKSKSTKKNHATAVGGEVIDLDDMTMTELTDDSVRWTLACRCGDNQGYCLTEQDLIENGKASEIKVPCTGCSLWIIVQYQVEEESV